MTHEEFVFERDLLRGNIARLCITEDMEELHKQYRIANTRIDNIYEYRMRILTERAKHEDS